MKRAILVLILFASTTVGLRADELGIYLAIGQSNMAGRAEIPSELSQSLDNVYLFTGNDWVPASNPLNIYSSIRKDSCMQRLGPAYGFARKLVSIRTDEPIGLVVNARGGTGIREWLPGTPYFKEIVRRAKEAQRSGTIRGVIWHQGESDADDTDAYLDMLESLITGLRTELEIEDLPFVAAQLSEDKENRQEFNTAILALPQRVAFTRVVLAYGTTTFDGTHFDATSQILMGERYSDKMLELLPKVRQRL